MEHIFLIVDDHDYRYDRELIETELSNNGIHVRVRSANSEWDALYQAERLHDEGSVLCAITWDVDAVHNYVGADALHAFLNTAAQRLPGFLHEKIIMCLHSVESEHRMIELPNGERLPVFRSYDLCDFYYGNGGSVGTLAAHIVHELSSITPIEASNDLPAVGTIGAPVYEQTSEHTVDATGRSRELKSFNPEHLRTGLLDPASVAALLSSDRLLCLFERSSPALEWGKIAYSLKDIESIQQYSPTDKIIFACDQLLNPSSLPDGVSAIIVRRNDIRAMHAAELCSNLGIPCLIGELGTRLSVQDSTDCSGSHERTSGVANFPDSGIDVTVVSDGHHGLLVRGCEELTSVNRAAFSGIEAVLDEAATILRMRDFRVLANADTGDQVRRAAESGAEEVGLVRSEMGMLLAGERELIRQCFIHDQLPTPIERRLYACQRSLLCDIFSAAHDSGIVSLTFRLFAALPSEFLDANDVNMSRIAMPTMGERPGKHLHLFSTQIRALCSAREESNYKGRLSVLVPNATCLSDFRKIASSMLSIKGTESIEILPMIESAALLTELSEEGVWDAGNICYGTNDLTSEFLGGIKRHDHGEIVGWMQRKREQVNSPFVSLTHSLRMAIERVGQVRRNSQSIICGAQATDPHTIDWAVAKGVNLSVPAQSVQYTKIAAAKSVLQPGWY